MLNNFIKTILKPSLLIALILFCKSSFVFATFPLPSPPQLSATSYLLMEAETGKILVENNADMLVPPASLTKLMTSYIVALELQKGSISLEDKVPVSVKAWRMGGSQMFIREGTEVLLSDLLKGLIIVSGNDASVALAEYIGGDESGFVDMMNYQANILGMHQTSFKNSHGMPAEGHKTTARDLSLLARGLIYDFPEHYDFYSQKSFSFNGISQPNRNGLLSRDEYVDGMKTGHTSEAGYCLIASAKKNGMRLISVVMGTNSSRIREDESKKLFGYGFRNFEVVDFFARDEPVHAAKVWFGKSKTLDLMSEEPVNLTLQKGTDEEVKALVELQQEIKAPIKKGQAFGTVKLMMDDNILAEKNLVAMYDVEQLGWLARTWEGLILFIRNILGFE